MELEDYADANLSPTRAVAIQRRNMIEQHLLGQRGFVQPCHVRARYAPTLWACYDASVDKQLLNDEAPRQIALHFASTRPHLIAVCIYQAAPSTPIIQQAVSTIGGGIDDEVEVRFLVAARQATTRTVDSEARALLSRHPSVPWSIGNTW